MPQDSKPVTDPPEEIQPDKRDNIKYWLKWIPAAKKAAKTHWDRSAEAYREFLKEQSTTEVQAQDQDYLRKSYPIWYSSVKTMQPALYARTPRIETETHFGIEDDQARRGCKIIDRLGEYLLEESEIDDGMNAGVLDAINADKATMQLAYDSEIGNVDQRENLQVQQDPQGQTIVLDSKGQIYNGTDVQQDEQGYFRTTVVQKPINQKITLCPLPYDEVIHNPEANTPSKITEMAYKFSLSWEQAVKRFGEDKCRTLIDQFKVMDAYDTESRREETPELPGKYLEGWECWCLYTKKVYWVHLDYKDDFLDVKDDPYGLHGFFPSPKFVISSKPPKSLYPTPPYWYMREIILQLHSMQNRIFKLIRSIRRRFIIDGAEPELIEALNDLDGQEFVTAQNLQGIVEKGGLESLIYFIPVAEFVAAIGELSDLEEKFKNLFFEWFGVPDILRGATDPGETAAAQEIKQVAANDRFKMLKKQIQELARDGLEMMIDLALKLYDNEKIAQIIGLKYSPDLQPTFEQDMQFLRNDEENIIRIKIETGSTNFNDEQKDKQEMREGTEAVLTGLQQVASMIKDNPAAGAVAMHAIGALLDKMPGSKDYVNEFKKYAEQLIQQAMNPPPPQVPPDYEGMKLEVSKQKVQNEAMAQQMDIQVEGRKLQQKDFELQLKEQKQVSDSQLEQINTALKQRADEFKEFVEGSKIQLQEREVQIDEALAHITAVETALTNKERMIDESLRKQDQLIETIRLMKETTEAQAEKPVKEPKPPAIHIHMPSGKKVIKKIGDGQYESQDVNE